MKHPNLAKAFLFIGTFALSFSFVCAQDGTGAARYATTIDKSTLEKGYTVGPWSGKIKLSLVPGIISQETAVEVLELDERIASPWNLDRLSPVYQFEFKNKGAYDNKKPFYIQLSYEKADNHKKDVYFYDKNSGSWRILPTRDFPGGKFVRSLIHLPFARIAVFSDPTVLTIGRASWYSHKQGMYAASPDFPVGSRLRVYALGNEPAKYVDVTVNDFGPDRSAHPDRVVDLEKSAFAHLASLGAGTLPIHIELLSAAKSDIAPTGDQAALSAPSVSSRSAYVINAGTGEVLFEKNAAESLPLASLSKIVAAHVFLSFGVDMKKVVEYKKADEEYNYKYCKPGESARLRLADGEKLTVENLFYSALVGSANNAVESLVRVSGAVREDFIAAMNGLAAGWGASSTKFTEPTGLSPDNVSSARDYAIIAKEALKNQAIARASITDIYEFDTVGKQSHHRIKNTNTLIHQKKLAITGSKTGYLDEAKYCLMIRADGGGGSEVIAITFASDSKASSFKETEELARYGIRKAKNLIAKRSAYKVSLASVR